MIASARGAALPPLLALAMLSACGSDKTPSPPPAEVVASAPLEQVVTGEDVYSGRFDARESVEVRPRVSGYVDRVAFRDGEHVRKGQLLFVIDPRPYQAAAAVAQGHLADAQSQVVYADAELGRAKNLIASGTVAQSLFDQKEQAQRGARAAATSASGTLEQARLNLGFTRVVAPMSGRIGRHLVSPGNLVQEGSTLLTTIVADDPIDIYFDIDEDSFLRYGQQVRAGTRKSVGGLGTTVNIALPGDAGPTRTGVIDFADNRLDPSTGTLRARARVANPDGALSPGQFADVHIIGDAPHKALLVPDVAVITDAAQKSLAVVGQDGHVALRTVTLGRLFGAYREIRSGLRPRDRVILSGLQRAKVGDMVRVKLQPLQPLASSGEAAR